MIDHGLLSGLPNGVRALLASPPLTDPRLLELAARWEGLAPCRIRALADRTHAQPDRALNVRFGKVSDHLTAHSRRVVATRAVGWLSEAH
jgi:hypothetical protein